MSAPVASVLFWLSVATCVVAEGAIIRAALRASWTPVDAGGTSVPRPRYSLEILWAVLPALALGVLFAVTWRSVRQEPVASLTVPAHGAPSGPGSAVHP